jgi:hypothetical protein
MHSVINLVFILLCCYVLIVIHDTLYCCFEYQLWWNYWDIPLCYFTAVVCLCHSVSHLCAYSPPFILFHFHLREVGSHPAYPAPLGSQHLYMLLNCIGQCLHACVVLPLNVTTPSKIQHSRNKTRTRINKEIFNILI